MHRKVVLTLLTLLTPFAFAMAQEGDPIEPEETVEREVILEEEVDSTYISEIVFEDEIKPQVPNTNFLNSLKLNTAALPEQNEKAQAVQKTKPSTSKSSFNFLYYLFFKAKKGDYRVD